MQEIILGIVLITGGLIVSLGAFFPRFRGVVRGTDTKLFPVEEGALGIVLLWLGTLAIRRPLLGAADKWITIIAVIGLIVCGIACQAVREFRKKKSEKP